MSLTAGLTLLTRGLYTRDKNVGDMVRLAQMWEKPYLKPMLEVNSCVPCQKTAAVCRANVYQFVSVVYAVQMFLRDTQ